MALAEKDLVDALAERVSLAERILDESGARRETYNQHKDRWRKVDDVAAGNWSVVWPDNTRSDGLPKIPNLVQLASEDRVRLIAAGRPTIVCRPESEAKRARTEKRERILSGYWGRSLPNLPNVAANIPHWAFDAMLGGVCAVAVSADPSGKSQSESFPVYRRLDARTLYPSPTFSPGPFLQDAILSRVEKLSVIAKEYNADLAEFRKPGMPDTGKVIEYHDDTWTAVLLQRGDTAPTGRGPRFQWLVEPVRHGLFACPVVIGVRPSHDGVYRGDFDSLLAVLNIWNRLMTLHLDAATDRVYPAKLDFEIENPEEWGPDASLHATSQNARFEFIQPPGAAFENHQLMSLMAQFARAGALLPPARSGDPNESVISAAGISAVSSPEADHVRSLQRDTLVPMLRAANELALCADEKWYDAEKSIYGYARGQSYTEKYTPSQDIGGNYRNDVIYGSFTGLDDINQNVMLLQQWAGGRGLLSRRKAMEQSPLVENPVEEEKQIALEQLQQATLAGIVSRAAAPPEAGGLDPTSIARVWDDLESNRKSLKDAVLANLGQVPMAPTPGQEGSPGLPGAPGIAGAGAGQQPERPALPPLASILAGPRP